MSAIATLPMSSDPSGWSDEEKALVEAAGLVHVDYKDGSRTAAPRPTVAAFLAHCQRTGLDPIARQIYCLARKSKGQLVWQIQVSIDGARLVAERSGKYEGQTPVQWTGDGVTWVDVWLASDPPRAARVGIYRAGFREPLYAVATWDAYVQTDFNGNPASMWRKMGPLMLGKCAEMLGLRKAFPQDLSGLYSAEEMSQATRPAEDAAPAQATVEAHTAPAPVEPSEVTLADGTVMSRAQYLTELVPAAAAAADMDALTPLYREAERAEIVGAFVAPDVTVQALLLGRRSQLLERPDEVPPKVADLLASVEAVVEAQVVADEVVS